MASVRPSWIDRDGILASGALYKYLLYVYITLHTTYSIPTSPIRFFLFRCIFQCFLSRSHFHLSILLLFRLLHSTHRMHVEADDVQCMSIEKHRHI